MITTDSPPCKVCGCIMVVGHCHACYVSGRTCSACGHAPKHAMGGTCSSPDCMCNFDSSDTSPSAPLSPLETAARTLRASNKRKSETYYQLKAATIAHAEAQLESKRALALFDELAEAAREAGHSE